MEKNSNPTLVCSREFFYPVLPPKLTPIQWESCGFPKKSQPLLPSLAVIGAVSVLTTTERLFCLLDILLRVCLFPTPGPQHANLYTIWICGILNLVNGSIRILMLCFQDFCLTLVFGEELCLNRESGFLSVSAIHCSFCDVNQLSPDPLELLSWKWGLNVLQGGPS